METKYGDYPQIYPIVAVFANPSSLLT